MNESSSITAVYKINCSQCTPEEFQFTLDYFDRNSFFITEPQRIFTAYWNTSTPVRIDLLPTSCKVTLIRNQF